MILTAYTIKTNNNSDITDCTKKERIKIFKNKWKRVKDEQLFELTYEPKHNFKQKNVFILRCLGDNCYHISLNWWQKQKFMWFNNKAIVK